MRADLDELDRQAWPPEVARLLADVRRSAERLDGLTAQPAGKSGLQAVSAQADQMLTHANSATQVAETWRRRRRQLVNRPGASACCRSAWPRTMVCGRGSTAALARKQIAGDAEEFQRAMAQFAGAPFVHAGHSHDAGAGPGLLAFFMAIKRQPNARGWRTWPPR